MKCQVLVYFWFWSSYWFYWQKNVKYHHDSSWFINTWLSQMKSHFFFCGSLFKFSCVIFSLHFTLTSDCSFCFSYLFVVYDLCLCCFRSVYLLLLLWAVYRVTGVCFRNVLGIITKKNILEHLEELKQQTQPLVTSPAPLPPLHTVTPLSWATTVRRGCMESAVENCWQFPT